MLNTIDKLNVSYNGIFYNNKPMTESEQMHYLLSKLNLIIEHFNVLDDTTREKIKEIEETVNSLISVTNDISDEVANNLKMLTEFKKLQESINVSNDVKLDELIIRISNIEESLKTDDNNSSDNETKIKKII